MTGHRKNSFISDEEYQLFQKLILNSCGIVLKENKKLTFHAKISHRLGILGIKSYREYYDYIANDSTKKELFVLASHITNKETYFFREKPQLDAFSALLPDIKKEKINSDKRTLKIASVACSSGEEAYTLNIIIQECGLFMVNWDIQITGIDIDNCAIATARQAHYTKNSFRGLHGDPGNTLKDFIGKHFYLRGNSYILKKPYTKNVEFRLGNIIDEATYSGLKEVDVIFCRNVMIYMSDSAISRLMAIFYDILSASGHLFIGTSESLLQKTDLFIPEYLTGVIAYRKNVKD